MIDNSALGYAENLEKVTSSSPAERQRIKSLLRWAGGKQLIVDKLIEHLPEGVHSNRYIEPFLGAASLFLAVRPQQAILGDANAQLIDFYRWVRDRPDLVARRLSEISKLNSEKHYYQCRERYNAARSSATKAALFLYLNRTSFNGIYRVNKDGRYNVPFGDKPSPTFPVEAQLVELSHALAGVTLLASDYGDLLRRARAGDFIYLDPPYAPINQTSNFAHYTASRFLGEDQLKLARLVRKLDEKGCLIMMTNSDTSAVRLMYKDMSLSTISVRRYVTCKTRHAVKELVIKNY